MDQILLIKHSSYCNFLEDHLKKSRDVHCIKLDNLPTANINNYSSVILTPLREVSRNLKNCLLKYENLVLMIDYNHYFFNDLNSTLESLNFESIKGPVILDHPNFELTDSPYSLYLSKIINNSPPNNVHDFLFISQPLTEDKRGLDQFKIISHAAQLAKKKKARLFIKRHPRETTPVPQKIATDEVILSFNGSIEEGIKEFKNLIGYNSLPLLASQALKREVLFWNEKENCFSNYFE